MDRLPFRRIAHDRKALEAGDQRPRNRHLIDEAPPDRASGDVDGTPQLVECVLVNRRKHDGRVGPSIGAQLQSELERRRPDGDHDADRLVSILLSKEDARGLTKLWTSKATEVQILDVYGDRLRG